MVRMRLLLFSPHISLSGRLCTCSGWKMFCYQERNCCYIIALAFCFFMNQYVRIPNRQIFVHKKGTLYLAVFFRDLTTGALIPDKYIYPKHSGQPEYDWQKPYHHHSNKANHHSHGNLFYELV